MIPQRNTPKTEPCSVHVLGVPLSPIDYASLLARIDAWGREPAPCRSVVFANVHVVTEADRNPAYLRALMDADLIAPDGMPLVWAMRLLGRKLQDRCYGPTAMERALATSERTGWRHAFYGSTPEVLVQLRNAVACRWPHAHVVATQDAPFGPFDDTQELRNIAVINEADPDLVWVGLGCPRQEFWLSRYRRHLHARAVFAVGAAFDFIAGTKAQAPVWMQRYGLEWTFRLSREPTRLWRRYLLRNPYFIARVAVQWARARRHSHDIC